MNRLRTGFTLIELLVVIAIIAILAAILFPVFAQAKAAAKKTASISNIKQAGLSSMLYMGDYDDVIHPLVFGTFNAAHPMAQQYPSAGNMGYYRFGYPLLLQAYSKNTDMFYDPSDTADDPLLADPQGRGRFNKQSSLYWYIFGHYPSYGFNRYYLNDAVASSTGTLTYYGKSSTSLEAPANTVMYADATGKDIASPTMQIVLNPVGYQRVDAPSYWKPCAHTPRGACASAQGQLWGRYDPKKVVVAWLDGHVKYTAISGLVGTGTTKEEQDRFFNGRG